MSEEHTINALRMIQIVDEFRDGLSGEFSAVHGISVNEFFMLLHLERATSNRLSRVDLAKRMHISASTITRMAAPMEKIGLVGREVDDRDARLVYVVATKAGREKLSQAVATFSKRAGYLFGGQWQEQELAEFGALLGRLIGASGDRLA